MEVQSGSFLAKTYLDCRIIVRFGTGSRLVSVSGQDNSSKTNQVFTMKFPGYGTIEPKSLNTGVFKLDIKMAQKTPGAKISAF
jgi:hypothetical protein